EVEHTVSTGQGACWSVSVGGTDVRTYHKADGSAAGGRFGARWERRRSTSRAWPGGTRTAHPWSASSAVTVFPTRPSPGHVPGRAVGIILQAWGRRLRSPAGSAPAGAQPAGARGLRTVWLRSALRRRSVPGGPATYFGSSSW